MDVTQSGIIQALTFRATKVLKSAFATYPAKDATGNVVGVPAFSFYADLPTTWPFVVCRLNPGRAEPMGIGGIGDMMDDYTDPATGLTYPLGTTVMSYRCPSGSLELRLGARSEVERERLLDWAITKLLYRVPPDPQTPPYLDQLGMLGITFVGWGEPVMPDMDPNEHRPTGMPPWPGQLFIPAQIELHMPIAPLGQTIQITNPSLANGNLTVGNGV